MTSPAEPSSDPSPHDFRRLSSEVDEAITLLRQSLRSVLDKVLPANYGARSLGRALDLERMTAWRCWTIAHVADSASAIPAMPGKQAWATIIKRLRDAGAAAADLMSLRASIDRFEALIEARGVDRTTMRALAAGALDSNRETAAIVEARRAAARGTSKVYGVHAKAMITAQLLAPGPSRSTASIGSAVVFEGLGRHRPGVPWPIMRRSVARGREDVDGPGFVVHEPLGDGVELPTVIRSVSTPGVVGRELGTGSLEGKAETIDLCDVPAERNHRLRVAVAEYIPSIELEPDAKIESVCLQTSVPLPVDVVFIDLLVHREFVRYSEPAARLLGAPVFPEFLEVWRSAPRLPLENSIREASSLKLPPRFAAADKAYREVVRRVTKAQAGSIDDYQMFRLVLPYPPMFSVTSVTFELDEAARRSG